jgi:hypothetical protein
VRARMISTIFMTLAEWSKTQGRIPRNTLFAILLRSDPEEKRREAAAPTAKKKTSELRRPTLTPLTPTISANRAPHEGR